MGSLDNPIAIPLLPPIRLLHTTSVFSILKGIFGHYMVGTELILRLFVFVRQNG